MKVILLIQPFPSILKHYILSVEVMLDRILVLIPKRNQIQMKRKRRRRRGRRGKRR
jgi:hypothetical protein